jgi:hypothetical protein
VIANWISSLSVDARIKFAQEKLDRNIDRTLSGTALRESNRVLLKNRLAAQIPQSQAANCYNALIESQLKFETLLLASLWDKSAKERNSIPSILELVEDVAVQAKLRKNAEEQYQLAYPIFRQEEVAKFNTRIDKAFNLSRTTQGMPEFDNLLNFRNFEIAHSITKSSPMIDLTSIRLAEPFWDQTIECVNSLYGAICLSGFDFEGAKTIQSLSALEFWNNLDFKIEL